MEISYGSKGISNFLVAELGTIKEVTERGNIFQIRMLEENDIPYLLRPTCGEINGKLRLKYNTKTAYVLDRMLIKKKPNGELLRTILQQICCCIAAMEPFLLNPNDLLLEPSYMFYELESRQIRIVCLPGYGKSAKRQMKQFLEYIMKIFDHKDREGVEYMYSLYEMASEENFDFSVFQNYVESIGTKKDVKMEAYTQKEVYVQKEDVIPKEEKPEQIEHLHRVGDVHKKAGFRWILFFLNLFVAVYFGIRFAFFGNLPKDMWLCIGFIIVFVGQVAFGVNVDEDEDVAMTEYSRQKMADETLLNRQEETECEIVFEKEKQVCEKIIHGLVPLTNGALETINLDGTKDKITVGRGKKESDYRLHTTQISRVHAYIYQETDGIYIEDQNSTNGTYLNTNRIPAHQKLQLHVGDLVAFANEEFFVF